MCVYIYIYVIFIFFEKDTVCEPRVYKKRTIVLDKVGARTTMQSFFDVGIFVAQRYKCDTCKSCVCVHAVVVCRRYVDQAFARELDGFRTATSPVS